MFRSLVAGDVPPDAGCCGRSLGAWGLLLPTLALAWSPADFLAATPETNTANFIRGRVFELNDNGAWSWFMDERPSSTVAVSLSARYARSGHSPTLTGRGGETLNCRCWT